jgi:hypothetical protein
MSLMRRKIKFSVKGVDGLKKSPMAKFFRRAFYGAGFLAAFALMATYSPDDAGKYMASTVMPSRPPVLDLEKYDYSDGLYMDIDNGEDLHIRAGDEGKHVGNMRFFSEMGNFRLKNLRLKISGVVDGAVRSIKMIENDGSLYKGDIWDGYVKFKNLYLKITPESEAVFSLYADFSSNLKFGQRLYFELETPDDLEVTKAGERVYIQYDYPMKGGFTSVVGWHEMF